MKETVVRCARTEWLEGRAEDKDPCDVQGPFGTRIFPKTLRAMRRDLVTPRPCQTTLYAMRRDPEARRPCRRHCDAQGRVWLKGRAEETNPCDALGRSDSRVALREKRAMRRDGVTRGSL